MTMIEISDAPLGLEHFQSALDGPIKANISKQTIAGVNAGHATIARLLESGEAIYGVNTGFGKLANQRIEPDDLAHLQLNIVRSHAAGVGEPLEAGVVRLLMLLKLKSLAKRWVVGSPG